MDEPRKIVERDAYAMVGRVRYEDLPTEYDVESPKCPECGQPLRHDVVWRYWRCNCGLHGHAFSEVAIKSDPRFAPPAANKDVFTSDDRQKGPI